MRCFRSLSAVCLTLGLAACNEAADQTAFDPSDTPSLCREVRTLSLTAQRDSFSFSFAQADQKFTKLIALYDSQDVSSRCPGSPSKAFLLASQGLALSNQEQFRLAQAAFNGAQKILDAQETPRPDEALLLKNFRVQDALNQGSQEKTATAFEELGSLMQDDGTATLASFAIDDLFTPDEAAIRRLVGVASSEYVRSVSLASNVDDSMSKAVRLAESEAAIDRAINLIGTAPSASAAYLPRFQIQKAVVQLEQGRPGLARVSAATAASSLDALLPGTPLTARALLVQAKAEADDGDRTAALETYSRAFSVYEENPVPIRSASVWPYLRLALEERSRVPSKAAALNAEMFRAVQIVRSSVAAKTISGAAALFSEGDTDAARAVRNWQAANDNYGLLKAAQVQAQFDTLAAPDAQTTLAREVESAESALQAALRDRDRLAPSYRTTLDAPISLSDVQSVLESGEALVQILTGQPRNVIFIVESDSVEVYSYKVNAGVTERTVDAVREMIIPDASDKVKEFNPSIAHFAYQIILNEAGLRLPDFDKLIFSVSGPLANLPLEMLVIEEPDQAAGAAWRTGDFTDVVWLGSKADISYVPSPRNLVDIRARAGQSAATRPVLAFGDFQPGANTEAVLEEYGLEETCIGDAMAVADLERLPETATEARLIAASLGTPDAVRLGSAFTKEQFNAERGALSDYRILHFATHGLLWPTPDCFSEPALAMSVTGASGDPLLTARDIRGLEMDAQLVVLSACETAGPATRDDIGAGGDSLSGLAQAFFAGGARAVVASHWSVFDEQTQSLMSVMYEEIGDENASFSRSLRQAQTRLRSDPSTSHPVNWAAFVVIGDGALTLK